MLLPSSSLHQKELPPPVLFSAAETGDDSIVLLSNVNGI